MSVGLYKLFHCFHTNPNLDDIIVQGAQPLRLEQKGAYATKASPFRNHLDLIKTLEHLSQKTQQRLDFRRPYSGGVIKDHSETFRWHAIIPPMIQQSALLSLRRQRFESLTLMDFHFTQKQLQNLKLAFDKNFHIIIIGPTGCGKTSLLHTLLTNFASCRRVLILENIPEITHNNPHWISLQTRSADLEGYGAIGLQELFEQSLRLRPDHFVFGEICNQQDSALFVETQQSGHQAAATFHAYNSHELSTRFPQLSLKNSIIITLQRSSPRVVDITYPTS